MSQLNAPHLDDEAAAFRFADARLWAQGGSAGSKAWSIRPAL